MTKLFQYVFPCKDLINRIECILLGLGYLLIPVLLVSRVAIAGSLLLEEGFEEGDAWKANWGVVGNDRMYRVDKPVRAGHYAVKVMLDRREDLVNYRTERRLRKPLRFEIGKEYWYGFSTYVPSSWLPDVTHEIIANWHGTPDRDMGEKKHYAAPLALVSDNGEWIVRSVSDSAVITSVRSVTRKDRSFRAGAIETEKWIDWVFHVKWSYGADGFLEVWRDGKRIISERGPTTYNDKLGPYFKFGIYKGKFRYPWVTSKVQKREIYFDEIRIGNSSADFDVVSPRKDKTIAP